MMGPAASRALAAYEGSSGEATRALYGELEQLGPVGIVAVNVFRAHKTSARAKVYRGGNGRGRYRDQAYDKKAWSMENLCRVLAQHGDALGIGWGWGIDRDQPVHQHVLYVELPTGQVSFHTGARGEGPDFDGRWDGVRGVGPQRICAWIGRLLGDRRGATALAQVASAP